MDYKLITPKQAVTINNNFNIELEDLYKLERNQASNIINSYIQLCNRYTDILIEDGAVDFKKNKSISVISKISDLKSSKIGELYDVKPIHDNMHRLCMLKLQGKSSKETPIPKSISKNICECLFEKNKNLSKIFC